MLQELTRTVLEGRHLSEQESEQALEMIISDRTSDAEIAAFLSALARKGETSDEVAGFARVMRRHAVRVRSAHPKVVDTAGTGGGLDTFNISTTAAFVIAGAGLPIAKHGNRAITSRCGSADLLTALGVNVNQPAEAAEESLNRFGVAFMFAPLFHPSMKRVAAIRRQLGHRTIFNLLGPLTNPASASLQIIGVYCPTLTEKLAQALGRLECEKAWVVHSQDGLDELSVGAPARVTEVSGEGVRTFELDPARFGVPRAELTSLRGGTPHENAALTMAILEGRVKGPARDVVTLNAAAALHLAGEREFTAAIGRAEEAIDSGAALDKLRQLADAYSRNLERP
jgi:anthranilate phosphoribosyltransferase